MTQSINEYLKKICFPNVSNIEELSSIPHLPDLTGELTKEDLNDSNIVGIKISNSACPRHTLFKLVVEDTLDKQKSVLHDFIQNFDDKYIGNICRITHYLQENTNPLAYNLYLLIEINGRLADN